MKTGIDNKNKIQFTFQKSFSVTVVCGPRKSEISAFIQTDTTRSTRLVIAINNIYSLWGRKLFLLAVTYLPTNLIYPFAVRVTGIM